LAKLVNATDLKSVTILVCGFKSRTAHQMGKGFEMTKFRKKPVIVEAVRFCVSKDGCVFPDCYELPRWLDGAISDGIVLLHNDHFIVRTLEADLKGDIGDWVVFGIKGRLYPCKSDVFEKTYEPVGMS
jgi:hypothetical protein